MRLIKPGPAIWGASQSSAKPGSAASCSTIAAAIWRGAWPRGLARGRAPLAWKSPNSGLLAAASWGSRDLPAAWAWAEASGKARSMAATSWLCKVWAMRSMGPKTAVAAANPPDHPAPPQGHPQGANSRDRIKAHAQIQPGAAGDRGTGGNQINACGAVGLELLGLHP